MVELLGVKNVKILTFFNMLFNNGFKLIYIYIVPHPQTCAQTLSLIPSLKMSCHNGAAAEILTSQGPSQIC